ncbi:hypothetical protein Kpho02_33250 [Kitasatospora phosalacinea]|uniref:Uncharacterized protein n=1 Tax=Kitasatospora phosalacinea TaxID=2065 RepID=A0A9W6V0U9_9ACTN|nr:hypothetical protein [Kitasatospora phosalacinea]GLW71026.1 hypothetical protein Kpho02_33250 [Kitasatospora phosalacinea]
MTTPGAEPTTSAQRGLATLGEAACRYRVDGIRPEELPMIAAEALAAGLDTPALCELAGLPRNAASGDVHDAFAQALAECGLPLPDPATARRHALRRLAAGLVDGAVDLEELAGEEWQEVETGTAEERAFVALMPQCTCCLAYTLGTDLRTWTADLRAAARALTAAVPATPGC